MSASRFTLDTNILIYSVDHSAGPRHVAAVWIIDQAVGLASCLTLQAVSEFFAVTTRKRILTRENAAAAARAFLRMFPIVCAGVTSVSQALDEVLAGRASYWDALLVATAAEAGCSAILTEDMADGAVLRGIRIVNPFLNDGISPAARLLLTPAGGTI